MFQSSFPSFASSVKCADRQGALLLSVSVHMKMHSRMEETLSHALATLCTSPPINVTTPCCAPLRHFLLPTTARCQERCRTCACRCTLATRWGHSSTHGTCYYKPTPQNTRRPPGISVTGPEWHLPRMGLFVTAVACASGCRVSLHVLVARWCSGCDISCSHAAAVPCRLSSFSSHAGMQKNMLHSATTSKLGQPKKLLPFAVVLRAQALRRSQNTPQLPQTRQYFSVLFHAHALL